MIDVQKIRQDFPILNRRVYEKPLIYLDNAATSQKPNSVIDKIASYYREYNSNVHRGVHSLSMEATDLYEAARLKVAGFIGAKHPESIIWTRNTTESINLVANTWALQNISPGDEIVITQMEHHSNLVPWQMIAAKNNATLRYIPMTSDQTLDMQCAKNIITKKTKLVSVVHASNSLGTINPVHELVSLAKNVGAAFLLDGAQSVPHMPVNVAEIDCDFLAFSGHKMLGPTGVGVLYVKPNILETMDPFLRGGEMVLSVTNQDATWNDLPMKFEAGTPNIADAIGLGAAIDYLQTIGMDRVRQHERDITQYALDSFQELEELDLFGPKDSDKKGGIMSFHSSNVHPHDLGTFLDREGIAVRTGHHCTMPLMIDLNVPATTRASFYLYNTKDEVDSLVDSLRQALRYFRNGAE